MGKWNAFLVSLIPAGLAGYLCYLLVTIGLPAAEDMGTMFWGPLGAGFLGCVMCLLAPFGIAIFVPSSPKQAAVDHKSAEPEEEEEDFDSSESDSFESGGDEYEESEEADDDLDFGSDDDFEHDTSSEFESMEIDADEFSDEFDAFSDDDFEDDDEKRG
ncbi:MAG: hypothetical protein R3C12_19895 [Planctomycetaceae bacterium]|nr:hypothetical protein [Planctomycetaceae bacterium]